MFGTIVLNVFIAGAFARMAQWIASMQLIMHLPILQVIVPANVSAYFEAVVPLFTFDFLPSEITTAYVFDFDDLRQRELQGEILDQMQNLGYDTHNAIIILGSLGLLAFASLSLMFFYLVAIKPLQRFTGARYRRLRKTLFFGQIIQLTHGGYFEVLIAGYLNIRQPLDTFSGETAAYTVARGYWLIALFLLPLLWVYAMRRSVRRLNTRQFQSRFGSLFEDIKTKSKWTMVYYLLFILRRITYCCIAFGLYDFPCLQVQCLMWMNLFFLIYQGSIKPFIQRTKNHIEMINETAITIVTAHDLFFTELMATRSGRQLMGWSMIAVMLINAVVNISIVLWIGLKQSSMICKWAYRKLKWKLKRMLDPEYGRGPPQAVRLAQQLEKTGGPEVLENKKIIPKPMTSPELKQDPTSADIEIRLKETKSTYEDKMNALQEKAKPKNPKEASKQDKKASK